jgi:hypothetical protein
MASLKRAGSGPPRNRKHSVSRESGNNHFDGGRLAALVAFYIDCRRGIVIGGTIGHGGIAVQRRTNQADVDFLPGRGVGTAIDVLTDDVR